LKALKPSVVQSPGCACTAKKLLS